MDIKEQFEKWLIDLHTINAKNRGMMESKEHVAEHMWMR